MTKETYDKYAYDLYRDAFSELRDTSMSRELVFQVFSDADRIRIALDRGRDDRPGSAAVYFDGEDELMIRKGDTVEVEKAAHTTKIIKLSKISFLETLRHKMQMT